MIEHPRDPTVLPRHPLAPTRPSPSRPDKLPSKVRLGREVSRYQRAGPHLTRVSASGEGISPGRPSPVIASPWAAVGRRLALAESLPPGKHLIEPRGPQYLTDLGRQVGFPLAAISARAAQRLRILGI